MIAMLAGNGFVGLAANPAFLPILLVISALSIFVLLRFGLVSFLVTFFILVLFGNSPATLDSSTWYFGYGFAILTVFAAIVLYALRTSLGGRPLLTPSRLDD